MQVRRDQRFPLSPSALGITAFNHWSNVAGWRVGTRPWYAQRARSDPRNDDEGAASDGSDAAPSWRRRGAQRAATTSTVSVAVTSSRRRTEASWLPVERIGAANWMVRRSTLPRPAAWTASATSDGETEPNSRPA